MRIAKQALAVAVAMLATLVGLYLGAAALGSRIPANPGWREPGAGVPIAVASNGIHLSIIVPVRAAGIDWSRLVRPGHLRDPRLAGTRLAFGWGDRAFYVGTPTWADLKPRVALGAVIGNGPTLVHVDHLASGERWPDERPIRLSREQYRALVRFIAATFALAPGRQAVAVPGYGDGDVFYEARGRYHALTTCNVWAGRALQAAGVRVGRWTPFPGGVTRWFPVRPGG